MVQAIVTKFFGPTNTRGLVIEIGRNWELAKTREQKRRLLTQSRK